MIKNSAFLLKIFCTMVAFFYITPTMARNDNLIVLADPNDTNINHETQQTETVSGDGGGNNNSGNTKILCNANEYLASCGENRVIGTYWLMGLSKNIYDYSENSSRVNMENLRKFFRGEALEYLDEEGKTHTLTAEDVQELRKGVIHCHPSTTGYRVRKCEKCPLNGSVPASTITFLGNSSMNVKYDIYTIADCYVRDFSDSTGKYKYVSKNDDGTPSSQTKEKCYYYGEDEVTGLALPTSVATTQ